MGSTKESEFESRYGTICLLLYIVQTGSGVHPASYPVATGVSLPGIKRQEREADHSPPTSAEVKKTWTYLYTSTSLNGFMA
jgi:hypothetical protein